MRTIAVTGGRTANFAPPIWAALDDLHATELIDLLLHGAADGADAIAANWAQFRGVKLDEDGDIQPCTSCGGTGEVGPCVNCTPDDEYDPRDNREDNEHDPHWADAEYV